MRKQIFLLSITLLVLSACSEKSKNNYGEELNADDAIESTQLISEMGNAPELEIKLKGQILDVCQEKGCWLSMDIGKGDKMRVIFKDHAFFVPKDCVGKQAVIEGKAYYDVTSVEDLRHFAADARKSQKEIDAITEPSEELIFEAKGVLIL